MSVCPPPIKNWVPRWFLFSHTLTTGHKFIHAWGLIQYLKMIYSGEWFVVFLVLSSSSVQKVQVFMRYEKNPQTMGCPLFNTKHLNPLRWRHNDHDSVSNHQSHGCLLNRLFRRRSKKISKLSVTGLCAGNSPGPVNSPQKGPVTRKMFPFDDVIMQWW